MRYWISTLGEETFYEEDLPGCCQQDARSVRETEDSFECPSCGAVWQAPLPVEPERCAFSERRDDDQRKGAA